jgi:hypothetical protein
MLAANQLDTVAAQAAVEVDFGLKTQRQFIYKRVSATTGTPPRLKGVAENLTE